MAAHHQDAQPVSTATLSWLLSSELPPSFVRSFACREMSQLTLVIKTILKHPWAEGWEKEDQKCIVKYYECFES